MEKKNRPARLTTPKRRKENSLAGVVASTGFPDPSGHILTQADLVHLARQDPENLWVQGWHLYARYRIVRVSR